MKYRQRTNDFIDNGKVYDIYDIKHSKKVARMVKIKAKKKYKQIRIIKRTDGYYILVR